MTTLLALILVKRHPGLILRRARMFQLADCGRVADETQTVTHVLQVFGGS